MSGGGVWGAQVSYMVWHGVWRMMWEGGSGDMEAGAIAWAGAAARGLPLSVTVDDMHEGVPKGGQDRSPGGGWRGGFIK